MKHALHPPNNKKSKVQCVIPRERDQYFSDEDNDNVGARGQFLGTYFI